MVAYANKLHSGVTYEKIQRVFESGVAFSVIVSVPFYTVYYLFMRVILDSVSAGFFNSGWSRIKTAFTVCNVGISAIDFIYFLLCMVLCVYSIVRLRKISGQLDKARDNYRRKPEFIVAYGAYGQVRHPMYGTLALLIAGLMMPFHNMMGIVITIAGVVTLYSGAIREEVKVLIPNFGKSYHKYRKIVKDWLFTGKQSVLLKAILAFSVVGLFC